MSKLSARTVLATSSIVLLCVGFAAQGCGSDDGGFGEPPLNEAGASSGGPGRIDPTEGGTSGNSSSGGDAAIRPLQVEPASGDIKVTKINGTPTRTPENIKFVAKRDGVVVPDATWFLQQGELGTIDASGIFVPNGNSAGQGKIIATANGGIGEAVVNVTLEGEQNGGSSDGSPDGCGAGGCGGVGGEALGGAVSAEDLAKLKNDPPEADGSFGFLYPYEKTVFPRGILAPLLQWDTGKDAKAVSVKITSPGVTFTGFYQYPNGASTDAKRRVRIDQAAWRSALQANDGGTFLEIELKILGNDNKVYGPFKRQLIVSPAPLTGTVYYNSYNSALTGAGTPTGELGGVLQIRVTSTDPALAGTPVPSLPQRLAGDPAARKCTGCHTVSADGSSLFVQDGSNTGPQNLHVDYPVSMWFDLTKTPDQRGDGTGTSLDPATTPADANKFLWSAPYPDGSFVLASTGLTREARITGPSALFGKDGALVPSNGLPADLWGSTPAFSPDGRHVVFNFFQGTIDGQNAGGRSLVLYDFACGAAPGSVACGAGAKEFTNARAAFSAPDRYPAWPSFLADSSGVVFQNAQGSAGELYKDGFSTCTPYNQPPATGPAVGENIPGSFNCHVSTWYGQKSEVWLAPDGGEAVPLFELNGSNNGTSYLPEHTVAQQANPQLDYWRNEPGAASATFDDTKLNFQPTVNPVPSGGYHWIVFTSRRRYGNVLNRHPFHFVNQGGTEFPIQSNQKKLWVAAVDVSTGRPDRSHPAFYLPGQELNAGNSRGFWVVDPCKTDGNSCETGDQCCGGSCRTDATSGQLTCQPPPAAECKPEFDACTSDADCCDSNLKCINSRCARKSPNIPN